MPIVSAGFPRAGEKFGPYQLEEPVGGGGTGLVYRASKEDGTVVALKLLRSELAADSVYLSRFEREGRIAREIDHPRLVHVVDVGEVDGRPYIAARFVDGAALDEWLLTEGPLSAIAVAKIAWDVAAGLTELHRRGILHRDVKPSNVLVDAKGRALVTDFGLAKGAAHTALTRIGRVVGTIDYLAPEVIQGHEITAAADVYALGCLVYECLTGTAPFAMLTRAEACIAHVTRTPPDPAQIRPDVPAEFSWAVLRALAKEPAIRPRSALAYARLLRASAGAR